MRRLLSTLAVLGFAAAYRVAVVNDVHGDLKYDPKSPACISKSLPPIKGHQALGETYTAYKAKLIAPLGQLLCDPPIELLHTMLKKLKQLEST